VLSIASPYAADALLPFARARGMAKTGDEAPQNELNIGSQAWAEAAVKRVTADLEHVCDSGE